MKTVNSVQTQLCLTAAALAGSAMGFEQAASAAINTTFSNVNIAVPATFGGVYIDLGTGATGGGSFAGWDFNPYQTASGLGFYWGGDLIGGQRSGGVETALLSAIYADLAIGTVVGPGSNFTSAIQGANPNYRDTGVSYLGFRFNNGGVFNYGYAAIQTTAGTGNGNGFPATILGWVFDDSGSSITVQTIPAPGAAGLLGLLAAGSITRRRKVA